MEGKKLAFYEAGAGDFLPYLGVRPGLLALAGRVLTKIGGAKLLNFFKKILILFVYRTASGSKSCSFM